MRNVKARVFLVIVVLFPITVQGDNDIEEVNCGAGETITEALENADSGDTIRVTGTCPVMKQ